MKYCIFAIREAFLLVKMSKINLTEQAKPKYKKLNY